MEEETLAFIALDDKKAWPALECDYPEFRTTAQPWGDGETRKVAA